MKTFFIGLFSQIRESSQHKPYKKILYFQLVMPEQVVYDIAECEYTDYASQPKKEEILYFFPESFKQICQGIGDAFVDTQHYSKSSPAYAGSYGPYSYCQTFKKIYQQTKPQPSRNVSCDFDFGEVLSSTSSTRKSYDPFEQAFSFRYLTQLTIT